MKNFRRALALVFALALTFAMGITAMANPSPVASVNDWSNDVTVPAGSSVVITGTADVSDAVWDSLVADFDAFNKSQGRGYDAVWCFDLQATGSGAVDFNLGTFAAGQTVTCRHFNEATQTWELIGNAVVGSNGIVTFSFSSFSPVALYFDSPDKNAGTATASAATTAALAKTATANSATSPKTGDMIFVVELFALACVATAAFAAKKAKQI